jgi:hypothetical protein
MTAVGNRQFPQITKTHEINFENVRCIALRHSEIFASSRNPFTAV